MKIKIKPIVSWSIWAGGLSLVMGIVTRHQFIAGFQADDTGMSAVIATVFVAGLVISFLAALQLHSEWGVLSRITETDTIPSSTRANDLASVFAKLTSFKEKGETIDVNAVIDTYHSKHNSRVRSVSILAALVVSMGLLGTVVGLIMSISGLGGMVENIGLSRTTMMEALKATVAGMGTAFYTTFFGALGGLILRAVAVSQLNSLSELCAAAAEYADSHLTTRTESKEELLNQKVAEVIDSFDGMRQKIDDITVRMAASFDETMTCFGAALSEAGNQAIEATKTSIAGMTTQLASVGSEVEATFGRFNESIEKAGEGVRESIKVSGTEIQTAIGSVNESIGKSGTALEEAFDGLNQTLSSAGQGVTESFDGLSGTVKESSDTVAGSLADFKLSLDGTTIELREAVAELHAAIGEATGEMKTLSKARLDADASAIAGHLSVAASSIQQFLGKKSSSEDNQKVA